LRNIPNSRKVGWFETASVELRRPISDSRADHWKYERKVDPQKATAELKIKPSSTKKEIQSFLVAQLEHNYRDNKHCV